MARFFSMIWILLVPCMSFGQDSLVSKCGRIPDGLFVTVVDEYTDGMERYSCLITSPDSPKFALLVFDESLEVIWETTERNDSFNFGDIVCFTMMVDSDFCNNLKELFNAAILSAQPQAQTIENADSISFELVNPMGLATKCCINSLSNCKQLTDVLGTVIVAVMNNDKINAVAQAETVRNLTEKFKALHLPSDNSDRLEYVSSVSSDGFHYAIDWVDNSIERNKLHSVEELFKIKNINRIFIGNPLDAMFSEFVIRENLGN